MTPPLTKNDNILTTLRERLRRFAEERDWEQFHSPKNLAMALTVESAELMEHFQWLPEAESTHLPQQTKDAIAMEMADVFLYLVRLADRLDIDLGDSALRKIALNAEKYPAERVRGSAKKYSEYE